MIKILGSIIVFTLFYFTNSTIHENPVIYINSSDSVRIDVKAYTDKQGLLEKYGARIYTPICEGDKCYAVEIDFYWDAIGRFLYYDTLPGKGLTKLDHIPFTPSDYRKLSAILNHPNSVLSLYTKEELVKDSRSSDIDGTTGATISEIRESVIEGAVYSSYTLWHIAHGPVKDRLHRITKSMFSKDFIKKMVSKEDQEINYFLINNFSENDYMAYLPEILEMVRNGEGYFAKNAIEKMPAAILTETPAQEFFTNNFDSFNYYAQVALLEKLTPETLGGTMRTTLQNNLETRDSYKNQLIKSLLTE